MGTGMKVSFAQTVYEGALLIAQSPSPLTDWSAHRRRLEGAQIRLPGALIVEAVVLASKIRRGER